MKPFIVVCTDFSSSSELALQRASDIAKRDETRVFLLHVFDPKKVRAPVLQGATQRNRRAWDEESMRQLKEARHRYFGHLADTDVQYDSVASEHPHVEICKVARDTDASLIVLGSHGRTGMLRRLLGSVAEATVRYAPCSVYVVRDRAQAPGLP